jgi:AhpD family alkylhydroperoxidase
MTERMDYYAAYDDVLRSGLSRVLLDLLCLRASQINGCSYCIDMHLSHLMEEGVPIEKLTLLPRWREAGATFDATERAALAWAETVTRVADTGVPDAEYEAAAAVFAPAQLADLTIAVGLINAYNRMAISFRTPLEAAVR